MSAPGKPRSAKELKQHAVRFEALKLRIAAGGELDAASLSRSYGLPLSDVERELRSRHHGK